LVLGGDAHLRDRTAVDEFAPRAAGHVEYRLGLVREEFLDGHAADQTSDNDVAFEVEFYWHLRFRESAEFGADPVLRDVTLALSRRQG
jgi:hypothetical protein